MEKCENCQNRKQASTHQKKKDASKNHLKMT